MTTATTTTGSNTAAKKRIRKKKTTNGTTTAAATNQLQVGAQEVLPPWSTMTDASTATTGSKRKRRRKKKKKKTANDSTATTVANQPVNHQLTTTDDSTATTCSSRKKKDKNNSTTVMVVTNETLGGEALPSCLTTTNGSNKNNTTPTTVVTNETVDSQEAFPPQLTTTDDSTTTTGSKHKKKKKKKKKKNNNNNDSTVTVVANETVDGQGAVPPQLTKTNGPSATTTGGKPKTKKKNTATTTNVPVVTGEIITVKLDDAIVNSKLDVPSTTGRLSEAVVHQYFVEQLGPSNVKWVNQDREFGLPYDIVITRDGVTEYVDVKESMALNNKWFHIIQDREWQFMSEKRDSSSIAHVLFPGLDEATIVMLRNPHRLCNKGKDLALALVMPKEHFMENMNQISSVALKPYHLMTGRLAGSLAGRLGEAAVHRYLVERLGPSNVEWMNQHDESGLPYDFVVTRGGAREYVEVKATIYPNKNWFEISAREWKFIVEKGDELNIARALVSGENMVSITMLKDPLRLYEKHDLNLTLFIKGKLRARIRRNIVNKLN